MSADDLGTATETFAAAAQDNAREGVLLLAARDVVTSIQVHHNDAPYLSQLLGVVAVILEVAAVSSRSRPSTSGLAPGGEGRPVLYFHRIRRGFSTHTTVATRTVATWVKDLNPKQLSAVAEECDTSQNLRNRRGATGVVGRGGAADPHGRTGRSGVNSSRPIPGRSRGIKFACDGTPRVGTGGQNGEAAGLVPAVLHTATDNRLIAAGTSTDARRAIEADLWSAVVGGTPSPSSALQDLFCTLVATDDDVALPDSIVLDELERTTDTYRPHQQ